ncbi:hypothetical protein PV08_00241 [Exophiala spinifera]|uniref:Prion-inhibition and propagation HeLo domain-containing protein n=1 Tax=Exophiala spinifera TaxID=91928 RepID=A0A0D2A494_9EURO|nr:uncharacterized protein PV08_00241 [Exophiala spinifera]KIW19667.1 hypothetical protein PV08_00241 [Exophiala spinifera]
MAETVGLAFALLGAFNNTVECFNYIQVARNFDQGVQTAVLKLDIAKLRLSRWGHSVGLDRVEEGMQALPGVAGSADDLARAKDVLEQILELFDDAEKRSSKLKSNEKDVQLNLDQAASALHRKLAALSIKRFVPKNVLEKAKWALHKEKYLNRLIQDITELVNGLIELFPAAQPEQTRLCAEEGSELALDQHVSLIKDIVAEQDPELSAAINKAKMSAGRERQAFNITFSGGVNHGLQQGYFSGTQTNHFGTRPLS